MKSLFKKTLSLVLAFMMMVSVVSAPSAYAAIKYPVGDTSEYEVSATFVEADGTTEAETIKPGEDAYLKLELKNFSTLNSGYAAITLDGGTFEEEYNVLKDSVFAKDDLISEFNAGTGNVIYGLATDVANLTSKNKNVKYYQFEQPTDLPLAIYRISVDEDATEVVATVSQNLKLGDANGATGNIAATAEGIILTGDTIIKKEEENSVVGIKILQKPYKTEYYVGDELVLDGLRVGAVYSNGETKEIYDYDVSDLDSSNMGLITVTHQGMTTTFNVTIKSYVVDEGTSGKINWVFYDTGILNVSGNGAMSSYSDAKTVPWYAYLGRIKVIIVEEGITTIGTNAFRDCPLLEQVSLPNTLTTVGYAAFRGNPSLKTIVIPDSVTTMSSYVFYECTALESITFSESIKTIGEYTFYMCKKLKNVTLPEKLTTIGASAFRGCASLLEIVIPYSVTVINSGAFSYCSNLSSVTVYNRIATIGSNAFLKCGSLKSIFYIGTETDWNKISIGSGNDLLSNITYEKSGYLTWGRCGTNVEYLISNEGKLIISGNGDIKSYSSSTEVPWSSYADQITSVVVEKGITEIGSWAFYLFKKLNSVILPEGIITIGSNAFRGCSALTEITIPSTVTTIGSAAISYCSRLATVRLSKGVTTIGNNAFVNCSVLNNVYYDGTRAEWNSISIGTGNDKLTGANIYVTPVITNINVKTLPYKTVYELGEEFNTEGLIITADYDDGVTKEISDFKVSGFDSETPGEKVITVTFGEFETTFTVVIKEPVVMTGIRIASAPSKVTYYDDEVIDFTGLEVVADYSDGTFKTLDTTEYTVDEFADEGAGEFDIWVHYGDFKASFSITVIERFIIAEGQCGDQITWTLNKNGELIISGTGEMTSFTSGTVVPWYEYRSMITSVSVSEGITSIGNHAFYGLSMVTIVSLPSTLTYIGEWAFYQWQSITEFELPDGITEIGEYAFNSCMNVTYVHLPESLTVLGRFAFNHNDSLQSIKIPEGVKIIPSNCFAYCKALVSVSIPSTVTTIGAYAFMQCTQIREVYYNGSKNQWNCISGSDNEYFINANIEYAITITGISVKSLPQKIVYFEGEEIDLTGLSIAANYSDDTFIELNTAEYTVTGLDTLAAGDNVITVTYGDYSVTFTVEVIRIEETGVKITSMPHKTVYEFGEELDLTGLVVTAFYSNGTQEDVSGYNVTGYDPYTPGDKIITVTYGAYTDTFTVTVSEPEPPAPAKLIELRLESLPYKTEYVVGEELDLTGVKVMADYDDGTSKEITEYDVSEYDPTTPGTQIIGLAYGEHMVTFEVVVRNANTDSSIKYPLGDTSDYEVSATFVNENGEKVESVNRGDKVYMLLELKNFKTLNAGFVKVELDGATILSERDMLTNSIFFKDYDMSVSGLGDNKVVYGLSTHVSNLTEINQNVRYHKFDGPTDLVLALYEIEPYATVTQVHANVSHNLKVGDANGLTGNIPATAEDLIIRGDDVVIENAPIPTYENPTITLSDEMFSHYPALTEFVERLNVTVQEFVNGEYYRTVDLAYSAGDFDILLNANHSAVVTFKGKYATLPSITVFFEVASAPDVVTYSNATATLTNNIFDRQPTTADFVARLKVTVDEFVNGVYNQTIELPLSSVTYSIVFDTVTNAAIITFADKYVEVPGITLSYTISVPEVVTYNGEAKLINNVFTHFPTLAEFISRLNVTVDKFVNGVYIQRINLSHSAGDYDVVINAESNHAVITFMGAYADTPSLAVPFTVVPQDIPVITVDSVRANAGGTVDVAISIENNPGILGMQLDLGFDPRLKLVDVFRPSGAALSGLDFTKPGILDSTIPLVLPIEGMYADDSNGNFLVLRFEVSDFAQYGDEYHISLGYANGNIYDNDLNDIVCNIINGKITIEGFTLGDVNKDGKVDEEDITTLQKGIAGGYGIVLDMAADLNSDGIYNIKDITLLRRLIANMGSLIAPSPSTPEVEIEG